MRIIAECRFGKLYRADAAQNIGEHRRRIKLFFAVGGIGKHIVLITDKENDVISLNAGVLTDILKPRMDCLVVGKLAVTLF